MQQFQDLPLPIIAGAGGAIVLILLLAVVLVRRVRRGGDPTRATPPRNVRPPKPPRKVRVSRAERRRARRAANHPPAAGGDADTVTVTSAVTDEPATASVTDPSPAIVDDATSSADDGAAPAEREPDPAATNDLDERAPEPIADPLTAIPEDADADGAPTAPITIPTTSAPAGSSAPAPSMDAGGWTDPVEDEAVAAPTAGRPDHVRSTGHADGASIAGTAADVPAPGSASDEWPTGSWEAIEELLPEAPPDEAGWGDAWDPDRTSVIPAIDAEWADTSDAGTTRALAADGLLDWPALGTVDDGLPHGDWVAEALAREATADPAASGDQGAPTADAIVRDIVAESPWEPVDASLDAPACGAPSPESPSEGDASTEPAPVVDPVMTPSPDGSASPAIRTPGGEPDASTLSVGSVGGTPVVIDIAPLAGLGPSMELVIEPTHDGGGLRLHLAERPNGVSDTPRTPVGDAAPVNGIAHGDDPAPSAGEAARPPVPARPDPTPDRPGAAAAFIPDAESAPSPESGSGHAWATVGDRTTDAVPATVGAGAAAAPDAPVSEPDPARILADIRARLAALDARRNGDVPPL